MGLGNVIVIGAVGIISRVFLKVFSRTTVVNYDRLLKYLVEREKDQPVITLMNHSSTLDDPMLWGLVPLRTLFSWNSNIRWVMGAKELTFTNPLTAWFFTNGRTIPTVRGHGIFQPAVNEAIRRMRDEGAWIHVFPEGYVNQGGAGMRPLRWGVARIISASKSAKFPTVLPIWHTGEAHIPHHTSSCCCCCYYYYYQWREDTCSTAN